jgi:ribosomal protein L11 methyltransferase
MHKAEEIRQAVLDTVRASTRKITPRALEQSLALAHGYERRSIREAVRYWVRQGELCYTAHFGHSFIELNFQRPVRISDHVVLQPPGFGAEDCVDDVVVVMQAGAAFGIGDHPTTRLMIQGLAFLSSSLAQGLAGMHHLDIGTGSGVLALVAAGFGAGKVKGIDTDPCAVAEACANVRLNRLEHKVTISGEDLVDVSDGPFDLITANLRSPSLITLAPAITALTKSSGYVLLSGMRREERNGIVQAYSTASYQVLHRAEEKGWALLALRRT